MVWKTALDPILNPDSVAIIGASDREGNFGCMFAEGLMEMGFPRIYPVHPRGGQMLGLRVYPGVKQIPGRGRSGDSDYAT